MGWDALGGTGALRFTETESETVAAGGRGRGERRLMRIIVSWIEFQFCKMNEILELDGGNIFTTNKSIRVTKLFT